jgi:hypothetical protein
MADKIVTDFIGNPLYRVSEKGEVSTWTGTPLGKADAMGTRDFLGNPISREAQPGLLYEKHKKKKKKRMTKDSLTRSRGASKGLCFEARLSLKPRVVIARVVV